MGQEMTLYVVFGKQKQHTFKMMCVYTCVYTCGSSFDHSNFFLLRACMNKCSGSIFNFINLNISYHKNQNGSDSNSWNRQLKEKKHTHILLTTLSS